MTTYSVTIGPDDLPDGHYTFHVHAVDASPAANVTDTTDINVTVTAQTVPKTGGIKGARPTLKLEAAFGSGPWDINPDWTDITSTVDSSAMVTIARGATPDNPGPQPGSLTFTLNDQDRRYDPLNTDGPYYGQLDIYMPVRVTGSFTTGGIPDPIVQHTAISTHTPILPPALSTQTVPLGYGFVTEWPQAYLDQADKITKVAINAIDGVGWLATQGWMPVQPGVVATDSPEDLAAIVAHQVIVSHQKIVLGASYPDYMLCDTGTVCADPLPDLPAETSGSRISTTCQLAGIPSAYLAVDGGQTMIVGGFPPEKNLLDHFRQVTLTEYGRLYSAPDNTLTFHERRSVIEDQIPIGTISERDGTVTPFAAMELSPQDRRLIISRVVRTLPDGTDVVVQDQASMNKYGIEDSQSLPFYNRDDAIEQAVYLVDRFKQPTGRIVSCTIKPDREPTIAYPLILTAELGQKVALSRTPLGVGTAFEQVEVIEKITHTFNQTSWVTTLDFLDADTTDYGQADVGDLADAGVLVAY